MPQALLRTRRLALVPLADEHLEHEVELDSDAEVLRYLFGRARTREEVTRAHVTRLARGRQVDGLGMWVGFAESANPASAVPATTAAPGGFLQPAFVGLWMLTPPHGPSQQDVPGEADLGYRVLRRYWRRGLASEGARELIRHGFEDLGLHRIFAQTMAVNAASRATMSAVGMRFARSFTEQYDEPLPGSEHGEVEYEIRRDDWQARRTSC